MIIKRPPQARIDEQVEDVEDEIHDHEPHGGRDDHALHDGRVAVLHGVDHQLPHPRQREDRLDDDRAAEQIADAQAEHGERIDERVAEHIAADDHDRRQAAADSRPYVVLVELLDHGRTDDAGEPGGHGQGEREGRERHGLEPTAQRIPGVDVAAGREPARFHRQILDHEQREPETGRRHTGQRDDADQLVRKPVAVDRGGHAEKQRDDHRDAKPHEGQLHGERKRGGDLVHHR